MLNVVRIGLFLGGKSLGGLSGEFGLWLIEVEHHVLFGDDRSFDGLVIIDISGGFGLLNSAF